MLLDVVPGSWRTSQQSVAWFRALPAAFDATFVFASLMFASADEAFRLFYALAEVVARPQQRMHMPP